MPLASQIELPERYRVARHIASGGMASVWEAEDLLLGRVVAVKVLAAHYAADPGARARFKREARTAAQVSDQSHVVTIYDIGEHENDAFIVMEYFAGGTVADRIRRARESGEPLSQETALRWLGEAAAGLDVAHGAGIVHRDVKPANLLLDAHGRLAVADFGIARLVDDTQMTQTGQVLGTAAYISPEQARGLPATDASDRYALAVVAYELLTGSRLFQGGPPTAQALAHAEAEPPRASHASPNLPTALDAVLARGLAKDPADRPASAGELVAAITDALGAQSTDGQTRPFVPPTKPTERMSGRAPAVAAIVPQPPSEPAGRAPPPPRQQPAPHPRGPDPSPQPGPARARRGSAPALIGALLAAVAVIALVLVLSSGGDDPQTNADRSGSQSTAAKARTATTPAAQKPQTAPAAAATPTSSGSESAAKLNDRGYALIGQQRYSEAVAPLQASVAAYRAAGQRDLPYAFALYNLGLALNRSGNPQDAVPVLRERLKFDNQRPEVQAELDDALAKLGESAAPGKSGKARKNKDG